MAEINLLPEDLSAQGPLAKAAGILKQVAIVTSAVFVIAGLGAGAFLLILSLENQEYQKQETELKREIKQMEQSEQQYFLLKDRLEKASKALKDDLVQERLSQVQVMKLPTGVTLRESEIDPDKTELMILAESSGPLASFFSSFLADNQAEKVVLKNFGFNPNSGYLVGLEVF